MAASIPVIVTEGLRGVLQSLQLT